LKRIPVERRVTQKSRGFKGHKMLLKNKRTKLGS
jgi:hypothetical protein